MTWLSHIRNIDPSIRVTEQRKYHNGGHSRHVVIEGVHYGSIKEAMEALGISTGKLYRLLGEGWRKA
jgi:TPP-dependent indolepyruvate ferredoxin oxidoreductase alpha subunit